MNEERAAGVAAIVLILGEFLPWYGGSFNVGTLINVENVHRNYSGFQSFSLVELALVITAVAVLALLLANRRVAGLHLPVRVGTLIAGAGVWSLLLLLFRTLDRPEIDGLKLSLQWGFLVVMAAAAVILAAGLRMREETEPSIHT